MERGRWKKEGDMRFSHSLPVMFHCLETPTMTIRGLQRLLQILGGKVASKYRALAETTLTRVMAGDRSLIKVIEYNATSNSAISEACRAALVNDPSPGGILKDSALEDITLKYQNEERALDIRRFDQFESGIRHYARNSGEVGEVRPPSISLLRKTLLLLLYRGILTPLNLPQLPQFTTVSLHNTAVSPRSNQRNQTQSRGIIIRVIKYTTKVIKLIINLIGTMLQLM